MSEDTVERWCVRTYELGFAECSKKFSAGGKTSLRRHQFELAKKGNATMLIWLGKQYLGQTDRPCVEEADEDIDPQELARILSSARSEAAVRRQALSPAVETTLDGHQ